MKWVLGFFMVCGLLALIAVAVTGGLTNAAWLIAGAWAWRRYTRMERRRK